MDGDFLMLKRGGIYKTSDGKLGLLVGYVQGQPILKILATEEFEVPLEKIQILASSSLQFYDAVAKFFMPETQDASNWGMGRYKAEIFILAKHTKDIIIEWMYEGHFDWKIHKDEILAKILEVALKEVKSCEFFLTGSAKERLLEFSPSVLDLSQHEIKMCMAVKKSQPDWRELREATFLAAIRKDVARKAKRMILEEIKLDEVDNASFDFFGIEKVQIQKD